VSIDGTFIISSNNGADSIADIKFIQAGAIEDNVYSILIETLEGNIQTVQSSAKCFDNPPAHIP
jgi:hypothetical protein